MFYAVTYKLLIKKNFYEKIKQEKREGGLGIIASKQLHLLEAIISFPKLRKVSFGKVIIQEQELDEI